MTSVLRVLVAVDHQRDLAIVEQAVLVATAHRARLEIVAGVSPPWCAAHAGMDTARIEADLLAFAEGLLRHAVGLVGDTPVRTRIVRGRAATHLRRRREALPGDVVLMRARRRFRDLLGVRGAPA